MCGIESMVLPQRKEKLILSYKELLSSSGSEVNPYLAEAAASILKGGLSGLELINCRNVPKRDMESIKASIRDLCDTINSCEGIDYFFTGKEASIQIDGSLIGSSEKSIMVPVTDALPLEYESEGRYLVPPIPKNGPYTLDCAWLTKRNGKG